MWDYQPHVMELKDFREEFIMTDDLLKNMKKIAEKDVAEDKERLEEVLDLLRNDNLSVDDSLQQIDLITVASQEERDLAKSYINRAKELIQLNQQYTI